ncbi:MAG: hypothetical protein ACTSVI_03175 [Promethearchaeota archaeon]
MGFNSVYFVENRFTRRMPRKNNVDRNATMLFHFWHMLGKKQRE